MFACFVFFFFKQKTAYEMRISDWSSDVCSSDLLGIEKAHIVGLSMGGYGTLNFGLTFPRRARSLVIAGCGYGSIRKRGKDFDAEVEATAAMFETGAMAEVAGRDGAGRTRVQFQNQNQVGSAAGRERGGKYE